VNKVLGGRQSQSLDVYEEEINLFTLAGVEP
jgi:hypothetical protein